MSTTAHDLALRYLLELSADIRGALLLDRDGVLLSSAGSIPAVDLAGLGVRLADEARGLAGEKEERAAVEIDVLVEGGALFLLAEGELLMACVTNRTVHPGLIIYDMHAVLRDLERAATAEIRRERETPAAGAGERA